MMKRLKRGTDNQAIGILPILLFIFMERFYAIIPSFLFSFILSLVLYCVFRWWNSGEMYHFVLYPVAVTQVLFSSFLLLNENTLMMEYASLFLEMLLVVVLIYASLRRRSLMRKVRNLEFTSDKQSYLNASFNEFFFTAQIIQHLFTLHLFCVLFFFLLPETPSKEEYKLFLFWHLPLILGLGIVVYEQIRLLLFRGCLKHEIWLPVLNDHGKVIGRIAHSISASSMRKFYHPVVRIAVVYNGMLYLAKRAKDSAISPNTLDYPFKYYVRFKQGLEDAVYEALSCCYDKETVSPRFLIRYKFENELVKHQVSVYVVYIHSEEQLHSYKLMNGKLWTSKQIEENLGTGLFSEYFEKEFPYLQNTVLKVDSFCCQENHDEVEV
ncbi:MAG: hypothetical protein PHF73_06915 [Massilibacteroides sp.]|nr:hypothetical protein [Massilibacteroides sp.]